MSGATLTATFSGVCSDAGHLPQNVLFKYGDSQTNLSETIGTLDDINKSEGLFTAVIDEELTPGRTYYYQAYMDVWDEENEVYVTIHGDILSFRVPSSADVVSFPNYYELPALEVVKVTESDGGEYYVSSTDPNKYYAYHMCAGGEKYAYNGRQVTARNFTVCFSAEDHVAYWVAAPRHSMYVGSGRHDSYKADFSIPESIQYYSSNIASDCNKGHLLGSAERSSSVATNKQVFYYSNIAPQLSAGYNTSGGGWNKLEDWVDGQVCSDTLYQVVGCYFKNYKDGYGNSVNARKISFGGRTDVSFPTMFYYVLIRTKSGNSGKALKDCSASELKCAAFVRCHTNDLKGQEVTKAEMMSVADLEEITGFTYFANVPNAPKSVLKYSDWGFSDN